jgi:multisubunit Na+/H+ antiporter MnhB subunit
MIKRLVAVVLFALVGTLALSACSTSLSDTKTLHGEAAKTSLTKVVNDSIATFNKDGGTEQITIGAKQFGLVFDPKAPAGKQTAIFDAATDGPAQYVENSTIFLTALDKLLASELFTTATYDYANSGFTVTGEKAVLTVQILDNRVNGTLLKGTTTTGPTQATINNYGVNDVAKAKLDTAAAAPAATPAP